MSPLQHIARIRRDTFWIDDENSCLLRHNPLSVKLRRTIEHLSEGLYSKDVHFIFELIQNAEDNQYPPDVDPTLSFLLTREDPTGTPGADGALIVENNEVGFQPEHIEAICDVGQSTKTKQEGYIGEKGIGFKSVFQVTADPHVFSNGYSIRLPESEPLTGLGYIVPVWAKRPKALLKSTGTTLVLPLRPGSFEDLSKSLQQIAPETILFLKKLKSLCIGIEDSYTSTVIKDDCSAPLVRLSCEVISDAESPRPDEGLFWVKTINFDRRNGVSAAKRENILDRDVTVALPLSDRAEVRGDVYAYLPVLTGSGLPFLVNADFLLTSSREGIRVDHPWNHWLRDCIGPCFVQAFCELLTEPKHRYQAYRFLPLLADGERPEFFEGVAEQIHAGLAGRAIVVRQSGGDLITPEEARRADQAFRTLFAAAGPPSSFCQARLVSEKIERFSRQLEQLGVPPVSAEDLVDSLRDVDWLATRPLEWFVDCYEYLQKTKIDASHSAELRRCPIVPIEGQKLSCDSIQPIYHGASAEDKEFLQTVPHIIQAPIAFLRPRFRAMLEKRASLASWLPEVLRLYTFSQPNYCVDIADRLRREYRSLDELALIAGTRFLAKYCSSSDSIHDLPVVLHDKRHELVSALLDMPTIQHVVTPSALDPVNGWQHVFGSDQDRTHLAILSNRYAQDKTVPVDRDSLRQFLCGLGVTDTPLPRRHVVTESNTTEQSEYEKACFAATTERSTRTNIMRNTVPPGWLSQLGRGQTIENLDRKGRALTAWLRRQASSSIAGRKAWTEAQAEYFFYESHRKAYQSEFCRDLKSAAWLPTSLGPVVPKTAFIKDQTISAVLGNAVPYLSGDLPDWALDLLEVRRTAAPKDLVGALAAQAEAGAQNPALALKVYNLLDHLTAGKSLRQEFWDKPLIHVPHQGRGWFRSGEVVWSDRSETFGDAFAYLEHTYPKLREFFVEELGVKPDVDSESFANRWLALAAQAPSRAIEVEGPMTQIFQALLPECRRIRSGAEPPSWWPEFSSSVRFWCRDSGFRSPTECYVADDGEVRRLFAKSEAAFVWRPEKASYAEIEDLYRTLGAKFLSESLKIACLNSGGRRLSQPRFLTSAAKSLIWAWAVNTLDKEQYERIYESGILTALTGTTEEAVQNLRILFTLDGFVAVGKRLAYWDVRNRRLLVEDDETDREVVRQEIAETIARGIMLNRPYREVESFVFQMLCADTSRARSYISRRDWSLPAEGKSLLEGRTSEPTPESEIEQPDENNPASNEVREDGAADDEGARDTPQDDDLGGRDGDEHTGEHNRASHSAGSGQAGTGMRGGSGGAGNSAPGGQHKHDSPAADVSGRAHSSDAGHSATGSEKGVPPFISYVGTTQKDQESDSDGADAAHRRELEEKAIRFILDREKDLVPTPYGNPGFDLFERDGNDQPRRWVEVKAISGVWKGREVALTRPEYECAREHKSDFWLYVVENAADPERRKVIRIQDPAGKARNFKFDHGWVDVADQD